MHDFFIGIFHERAAVFAYPVRADDIDRRTAVGTMHADRALLQFHDEPLVVEHVADYVLFGYKRSHHFAHGVGARLKALREHVDIINAFVRNALRNALQLFMLPEFRPHNRHDVKSAKTDRRAHAQHNPAVPGGENCAEHDEQHPRGHEQRHDERGLEKFSRIFDKSVHNISSIEYYSKSAAEIQ